MVILSKVTSRTGKLMAMVLTPGATARSMMENGAMARW
jgi:hypothetical protein